jgi:hypothetical protein
VRRELARGIGRARGGIVSATSSSYFLGVTQATAEQGERDADTACFLARIGNLEPGSIIYLELTNTPATVTTSYLVAWFDALSARMYTPGLCGVAAALEHVVAIGMALKDWALILEDRPWQPRAAARVISP